METPEQANTPPTSENAPSAIVQEGNPAERPAGSVPVEWNMDVETMLNTRGFAGFLENYEDSGSFEMTEDNKAEIASRFRAFEASRTVARQFERAMEAKLQAEGKGRLTAPERQAYQKYVTEIASTNPDALVELQNDLLALEANPERIRQKEAEFEVLRESNKHERLLAEKDKLETRKKAIEKAVAEIATAQYGLVDNMLSFLGRGKKAEDRKKNLEAQGEWRRLNRDIKELEARITEAPTLIASADVEIKQLRSGLESARETLFAENEVAKMVRERLLSEARKRCEVSLEATDIGTLQKAAEEFTKDEKLAEAGSDYLGLGEKPGFAEEYKSRIMQQIEQAIETGIRKTLDALPVDITLSRFERAFAKFIKLSEARLGFAEKEESRELVLDVLRDAEVEARSSKNGSGKSIMLKYTIAKLEKAGTRTL